MRPSALRAAIGTGLILACFSMGRSGWSATRPKPTKKSDEPRYARVALDVGLAALEESRAREASPLKEHHSLTLEECEKLALERNLALEQSRMEALTKEAIASSYKTQTLPRIIGSGELSRRDNYAFSFSEILGRENVGPGAGDGTGVNNFSRGRDRGTWRYSLEARWSLTDAALAHYLEMNARNDQEKERLLRVRIAQKLLGVVASSFQRLRSLQEAESRIQQLVEKREKVGSLAAELHVQDLAPIESYHRINQKRLQAQGLRSTLASERELQQEYLATAMRVSPDDFGQEGIELSGELAAPAPLEPIAELEREAVKNRPEAFQAGLDHMNALNDLNRTIVKYYPKITPFARFTEDIDKHLLNNTWGDYGAFVYFDIIEWTANKHENQAAKLKRDKTRNEIGAVALGIATQVREAALKYRAALGEVDTSGKILDSAKRMRDITRERVELMAQDELTLIEIEGDVLQEEIVHLRALGEANARRAELQSAIGTNYSEPLLR